MEAFEAKALATAPCPVYRWLRYVDDTFAILHEYDINAFLEHINNQHPHIQFTMEQEEEGRLPFLDTTVVVRDDGSITTTVYRKKTHTDQYLNFQSNHPIDHKRSVVRTLQNRAKLLVPEKRERTLEQRHIREALSANNYPRWMMSIPRKKKNSNNTATSTRNRVPPTGIPYIKGVSEKLKRTFNTYGVSTYHAPMNTLRSLLVHPKDKSDIKEQCGVLYKIQCADCNAWYIGETGRALEIRVDEHQKNRGETAVGEHLVKHQHHFARDNVAVIQREDKKITRKIKEGIAIQQQRPSLNRDPGFTPPLIYAHLLTRDRLRSRVGVQSASQR